MFTQLLPLSIISTQQIPRKFFQTVRFNFYGGTLPFKEKIAIVSMMGGALVMGEQSWFLNQ